MKNLIIILVLSAMAACNSPSPKDKFITKNLPEGIVLKGFNEKFNKPYGKWDLYFFMKNETGRKIEYPQVDGDLYLDGRIVTTVTGGPDKHLDNLDSGVVEFGWILPDKVPDSIIFRLSK